MLRKLASSPDSGNQLNHAFSSFICIIFLFRCIKYLFFYFVFISTPKTNELLSATSILFKNLLDFEKLPIQVHTLSLIVFLS